MMPHPPAAGRHPAQRTPLERKLELLEARFTRSDAATGSNGGGGGNNNNSQHSFAFDAPSSHLSNPTLLPALLGNGGASRSRSSHTNASTASRGLSEVEKATERHLNKVQQAKVVVWASDASNNSATVVANNCVVPDTPETKMDDSKPTTPIAEEPKNNKKRKSVPVRREEPSVKENVANAAGTSATTNVNNAKSNGGSRSSMPNNNKDGFARKRGRSNNRQSPCKERKKTDYGVPSSLAAVDNTSLMSPLKAASRDGGDAAKRNRKGPSNNATITRFFAPRPTKHKIASGTTTKPSATDTTTTTTTPSTPVSPSPSNIDVGAKATVITTPTPASRQLVAAPETPPMDRLERRVKDLEQQCSDKDEQLKAVSNNRTILHTALQSALAQRNKELEQCRAERKAWESQSRAALEALVRDRAAQEAKEVRERLAADGARLGRIVHSRAGMRVVETWEEGHASTQLQARRQTLRERKSLLQERYEKASRIAKKIAQSEDVVDENGEYDAEEMTVGGVQLRTKFDAMEAIESVRFHLQTVLLEEKTIATEEASLKDEKGAHVRALKRVASEDASRFKARPKLHDRYLLKRLLGKGGFSEVWRAYDLVELREVAVKIHQLDPRWSDSKKENYTKHVSREYEIHRNVRHPRIVSLFDVFEIDNNSFATVLECCDGTDLDTLLKNRRSLTERDARAILLQILSGMRYLSQPSEDGSRQGIIHYDLKPGNILFDEFGDAKITDFGLSKIVESADSSGGMELTSQGAGTYWYLPPECFMMDDNIRISNKVDVWSIGVIFYQMLFGRRPFGDGQSQDAILNDGTVLNAREVSFPENMTVSDDCKDFIRACLTYDQAYRPTVAQLCQHSYVLSKMF